MNISRLIKTIVIMVGFGLFTMFANAVPPNKDVTIINDETNPVPVTVTNSSPTSIGEYQFVGVTTQTVTGGFGINGAQLLCKNDFGEGAKMCTSAEVYNSPNLADTLDEKMPLDTRAWIRPTIVSTYWNPNLGELFLVDVTGIAMRPSEANCLRWAVSIDWMAGLTLFRASNGILVTYYSAATNTCDNTYAIACCATQ